MKIAVAGGTGMVGQHVVEVARERGHEVVVLTRAEGVDLLTADGLADALAGVDVCVDVASTQTQKDEESKAFFGTVTRHLLAAEVEAGVGHHVALGIVGLQLAPGFGATGEFLYVPDLASWRVCGAYAPGHATVMGWFEEKTPGPTGAVAVPICPRTMLARLVKCVSAFGCGMGTD